MKIKAIINPVSGRDKKRAITAELVARLKAQHGLKEQDFYATTQNNEGLSKAFLEECDTLVVAGGDGTLHNVINREKCFGLDKPIAYLPTGTTNDFGHCLALPAGVNEFCRMLDDHEIRSVDLGLAGNRYFHYVVYGGAVTSVSYTTQQPLKNKLGKAAYLLASVPQIGAILKGTRIRIESAEVSDEMEALAFFVSHSPIVAGYKNFIPDAQIDDGLLNVLVLKKTDPFSAVGLYADILRGTHIHRPDVLTFTTKRVSIAMDEEATPTIGIDGELCGEAATCIRVVPRAQSILVPARQRNVA